MIRKHKHKGVMKGKYKRLHSVSIIHKDTYSKKCHQLELNIYNRAPKAPKSKVVKKQPKSQAVVDAVKKIFQPKLENITIDKDNYIFVDLTKITNQKGLRVKFNRRDGMKKKNRWRSNREINQLFAYK